MSGKEIFLSFLRKNFDNAEKLYEKFDILTYLYRQVNAVINISALKTDDDIYIKHYLDSIYPYKLFSGNCCDVGCGGGFPCIPLSIVTGLSFVGVESVGKKLTLIERCKKEIAGLNVNYEYSRAEKLADRGLRFDTVCARAVSDTDKVLKFCAPLCKTEGKILLYKTRRDSPSNSKSFKSYNVELDETTDYILPGTDIERRMFIYRKIK